MPELMRELSPLGVAALEYAARGWPVFPLVPGGKLPAISVEEGGAGQHDATTLKARIIAWWERFPNANIGVNLKEAGLVVVDADTYKPECDWANQVVGRDIPETLRQVSASGGVHYFFTAQSQEEFPRNFCKGVDIKRNGYVLLEPSVFMGRKYRFETDDDIVPCPAWIPRKPAVVKRPASSRKDLQPTDRETWAILDWIDPDAGGYNGWVDILFAIHDRYEGSDEGFKIAEEWSSRGSKFEDSDIERRWNGIKVGHGVTWASACKVASDGGADLSQIASEFSADAQTFALLGRIIDKAKRTSTPTEPVEPDWEDMLVKTSKGFVIPNVTNILTVVTHHPEWRDCFAFDTFTETRILTQPIPGTRSPKLTFRGREMRDTDYVDAQVWFQRNGLPMITKNVVTDAIDTAFEASTFNALQNYFEALPLWSPSTHEKKIGSWLFDYCGVARTTDDRNLYVREVGARWLISAVARAMRPGCKADCVLILEGRQGAGKSTALAVLAGTDWFGDSLPPISHKDAKDYVRGKWIIEMAELANMNKAEVEEIKAFISRQHEAFRPAYARLERRYHRQCVFAGSTNKLDYLRDETGNRRFWPVQVGDAVDVVGLRRDRDLLWAEALYWFRNEKPWWLSDAVTSIAVAEQSERLNEDPWVSVISAFVIAKTETSIPEIAKYALYIDTGKVNRSDGNRIASVLSSCGFVRAGRVSSGDFKFAARFERLVK